MTPRDVPADHGLRVRRFGRVNRIGLWTLFLRDLLRELESWKTTVAGPALQSLLFASIFQLALGDAGLTMGGLDFHSFLVPGLVAFVVLERGFESTAFMMVYDKLEGMITDVIGAPVTPLEMTVGFGVMSAAIALITGAATWLVLLPFIGALPTDPLALIFFAINGGAMMGLVGLAAGLWADRWDHITGVQTFLVTPMLYLSGVFFSLDRLPEGFRGLAELNPAWFAIDGMRYGMTGVAGGDPASGAAILLAINGGLGFLCWVLLATGYKLKP